MGLDGVLEGRIVPIHQHLGDERQTVARNAASVELVVERLLQHVADGPLGIGHDQAERRRVDFVGRQFVAAQDEADLGPVAVGHHRVPARLNDAGNVMGGLAHRIPLVPDFRMIVVFDKRIAADSDHGDRCMFWHSEKCSSVGQDLLSGITESDNFQSGERASPVQSIDLGVFKIS